MSDHFNLLFNVVNDHHLSVAQFLQPRLTAIDFARLPELCRQELVSVDRQPVTLHACLKNASQLSVMLPDHHEDSVDVSWELLWENSELMAVFKPHNLPVSRTTRNLYNTLISLVKRQTRYYDARLLHRLDSETAGILLLAKDAAADRRWKPRLNQLIQRKLYHAWVDGVPTWQTKQMTCQLSEKQGSAIRSQVYVVDDTDVSNRYDYLKPRESSTLFRVLATHEGQALLQCQLLTGRKHQIRAQLSYLGYPLIGDKIYAHQGRFYLKRIDQGLDETDFAILGAKHHLLQAAALTLDIDGQTVEIVLPSTHRLSLL
ncbi:RNA pseudouridine synthase [Amphritea sp. 1_MG-2023]|uniref:RluA family pseudouridine synthase n=1 Tax=Amphritea sp. 1_MG-2023 TaxID=3062670 RepID=UPI0026E25D58|nr:RNA pseudouridine synthase [Amphritea sp. 1_MG-2023]MDO6562474.1 RNA pseudouridine synthase [Amphritea sp. 1_MG-2023]